jgi:hypothetical protein
MKENAMSERDPQCDLPWQNVSGATARNFLQQVWRELQESTATAANSAGKTATALMNVLLLSVVSAFAALAVLVLFIRTRVMEKPPAFGLSAAAQLQPLTETGEQAEHLT